MQAFVTFVLGRRRLVMAFIAALTLFFGLQINQNLRIVIDSAAMLPQQHPSVVGSNLAESLFGSRHLVVVGVGARDGGSVYQAPVMDAVARLSEQLGRLPQVRRHTLISATAGRAKAIGGHDDTLVVEPLLDGPPTPEGLQRMRQRLGDNPIYQGLLVSHDETVAAISFGIEPGHQGYRPVMDAIRAVVDAQRQPGLDIRMSGAPVFYATVETFSQRIAWLFGLALVVIGLIHLEAFRTVQGLLLPLVTAVLSVVWALGIMGTARVPMDAFNATTPILILAVAAGHAVQILKRYYEEFDRLAAAHPALADAELNRLAVRQSLLRVAPVMAVAGGVAALGLFSLMGFEIAAIRNFGLFTGLGILCALFIELSFIPALRASLRPPPRRGPDRRGPDRWDRFAAAVSRGVVQRRRQVLAGFALLSVASATGLWHLNLENSTKSYFGAGVPVRQDDEALNARLAGTNALYVVLQGEPGQMHEPATLALIERAQQHLQAQADVGKTLSIVDFVRQMQRSIDRNAGDALPATREQVAQLLLLYGLSAEPTDFDAYIDYDARSACIVVWTHNDSSRYAAQLVDGLRRVVEPQLPPGMRLSVGGSVPLSAALSETLVRGKLHNIAQMIVVIFLAGSAVFRSWLAGLYLSLPLAATVLVNFGVMGLTGIPLNTPTSVSAAMIIGIGADYAIYLLYRMREEMAARGDLDAAIAATLHSAGKAVIYVATAVAGGYSVLLLSQGFFIHIWFGVLVVVSMIVSAVSALLLVPALVRSRPPWFLQPRAAATPRAPGLPGLPLAVLMVAVAASLPPPAQAAALADQVMERNHQATRVASSVSTARFVLVSPGGQERVRETLGATRLQADGVHNRRVVRFLSPGDVRNMATLIVEQPQGDDQIWVYLPSLKKTRRVSSDNKKGSFMGTDLSYADMVGHRPADWRHALLREEQMAGGRAYVIESVPRTPAVAQDSGYSRRVSWVLDGSGVAARVEFHDTGGRLLKTLEASDIRLVDAAQQKWQPMRLWVKNHQTGHQTRVEIGRFDTTPPAADEMFSTRWIEREE